MRRNVILYYVLMLLLVMGAFASMALNAYGITLMSYVMLGFCLLFGYELAVLLPRRESMESIKKPWMGVELAALALICLVYFLKALTIQIPQESNIVFLLSFLLMAVNIYFFYRAWTLAKHSPMGLKLALVLYFLALFMAWLAVGFFTFENTAGIPFTVLAILAIAGFAIMVWKKKVIVNGEETNGLKLVGKLENKSTLQLVLLMLVVIYYSLSSLNILSPLYFGSLPNGYYKVVQMKNNKSGSTEKGTDPTAFEEAYKAFISGK
ncbi:MAG TPA: hypothetical protein VK666_16795 [Chryseolinea sp.]|nr:hypothetical protein [Chryseolinea sp.]